MIRIDKDAKVKADSFYEKLDNWLHKEISGDTSGIFVALYNHMNGSSSTKTFPDEKDQFIAGADEKDIKFVNGIMEMLLEKISKAPADRLFTGDFPRTQNYHQLVRSYLIASSMNPVAAAQELRALVWERYPEILYARELDTWKGEEEVYWLNYLVNYAESCGQLAVLWTTVRDYFLRRDKEEYWNYCYFYIQLYGKVAIRMLDPAEFYNDLHVYVESNFMFLKTFFKGILSDYYMRDNRVILDRRWKDTFNK